MYNIYQVKEGETIESISNNLGIDKNFLIMLNGFNPNKVLITGEQIIVPITNDNKFRKYIVKKGDNVYNISKEYGVNYKDILMLNGLEETDIIYPNQELLIPNSDISLYKVIEGDTIDKILNNTNNTIEDILDSNMDIYLLPEQIIFYKNNR